MGKIQCSSIPEHIHISSIQNIRIYILVKGWTSLAAHRQHFTTQWLFNSRRCGSTPLTTKTHGSNNPNGILLSDAVWHFWVLTPKRRTIVIGRAQRCETAPPRTKTHLSRKMFPPRRENEPYALYCIIPLF